MKRIIEKMSYNFFNWLNIQYSTAMFLSSLLVTKITVLLSLIIFSFQWWQLLHTKISKDWQVGLLRQYQQYTKWGISIKTVFNLNIICKWVLIIIEVGKEIFFAKLSDDTWNLIASKCLAFSNISKRLLYCHGQQWW